VAPRDRWSNAKIKLGLCVLIALSAFCALSSFCFFTLAAQAELDENLAKLERYERRAFSMRKRAVRALDYPGRRTN
jgi:hypothetical protein